LIATIYMTFLAVAETGSFSKAAGKLFVSPVAVMNQMNELEGEVKAVLFVRTNRGGCGQKVGPDLSEAERLPVL